MAGSKGTLARILVDEFDFSSETSQFVVSLAINEEDCTVLTSGAAEYGPTLAAINIEQNGYMVNIGVDGGLEKELWRRLGVQGSFVACLIGIDNTGCPAYVQDTTFGASMEILAPATGILAINGSWGQGQGGHRGVNAFGGSVSATGTQPGVDTGAAGTKGGEAYLFVRSIGGTASGAQIKAQSATTQGGTYTDLATFTVNAVGAQKATFAGTVNRWVRLNVTNMGGATAFNLTLIVCSRGVTE